MICYLCGKVLLDSEDINDDHVPQSGFFLVRNPPGIKKLLTHKTCNSEFGRDEEYVINLIRATSTWDPSGELVWKARGLNSLTQPKKKKFLANILSRTKPAGEIFNNIPKDIENFPTTLIELPRLVRVLDKIVQGLYFSEFGKTLESEKYKINPSEFLTKQELKTWNIGKGFNAIGNPGKEEFKYYRSFMGNELEYFMFFYNTHFFRILYNKA